MLRASSLELANTSLVLLVCAVRWGAVWSVFILYVDTDARVIKGPGASDGLLRQRAPLKEEGRMSRCTYRGG